MQSDGNAVVYDSRNVVTWSSNTAGKGVGPYKLVINDDNSLTIVESNGNWIWSSMRDKTSAFRVATTQSTGYTPETNTFQLKNLDVNCGGNALNQFYLKRDGVGNYKYDFTCSTAANNRGNEFSTTDRVYGSNTQKNTGWNDGGGGLNMYLDRHAVDCGSGVISQFRLDAQNNQMRYNYTCKNPRNPFSSCRAVTTPPYSNGDGQSLFLAGHNVSCGADEAMSAFRLYRPSGNTVAYEYKCCKF